MTNTEKNDIYIIDALRQEQSAESGQIVPGYQSKYKYRKLIIGGVRDEQDRINYGYG